MAAVLSMRQVTARLDDERFEDVEAIDFDLPAGQCLSIGLSDWRDSPLPGLALGESVLGELQFEPAPPVHQANQASQASQPLRPRAVAGNVGMTGTVLFDGIDWQHRRDYDRLACRGQVGWVLSRPAWVSNLNLLENVLLRSLHHTSIDRGRLIRQAQQLAAQIGLAEIPPARMRQFDRSHLRRAEWVRAFLGKPRLVMLHRSFAGIEPAHHSALLALARQSLDWGAGVLWLADHPDELAAADQLAAQHFQMTNGQMLVREVTG